MFSNIWQRYQVLQNHSKITKMHFWMIQGAKKRFLVIFWSLICWIDLILHIMIVLNVFQLSATLPGHEGSFKNHKSAFLSDPKSQKRFLAIFWSLVCRTDLIFPIVIGLNVLTFDNVTRSWRIIRNHKNAFRMFWSLVCCIDLMLQHPVILVKDLCKKGGFGPFCPVWFGWRSQKAWKSISQE